MEDHMSADRQCTAAMIARLEDPHNQDDDGLVKPPGNGSSGSVGGVTAGEEIKVAGYKNKFVANQRTRAELHDYSSIKCDMSANKNSDLSSKSPKIIDINSNRTRKESEIRPRIKVLSADIIIHSDEEELLTSECSEDERSTDISLSVTSSVDLTTKTYKRRFWILFVFSILTWFSCVQWNCWGPISDSMFAAFPDWTSSTVAMMESWVTIVFVFCMPPVCWITGRLGLRTGMLVSSLLFAVGLALRCITDRSPIFTIMCHVCAALLGISMTLIFSAPAMIASVWFPPNERTSATALIMAMAQLGSVGSYLEPLIVRDPSASVPISEIKEDVMVLMYGVAGFGGLLFLLIVAYFPSKPPLPPSIASSADRLDFKSGVASIVRNKNLVILILIYGVASGPSLGWIGVLNFSLEPLGFNQDESMFVGLVAVASGFVVTLVTARLTDYLYGYLKETIILLLLCASFFYYWFLLISNGFIQLSTWQVYSSVALSLSFNFATIPLFFELAAEVAFPVNEVMVGGFATASDSLFSTLFLLIYFFKDLGFQWVSYTLVASNALPVIALLFLKVRYTRSKLDTEMRES